jgi:hypothetical protein
MAKVFVSFVAGLAVSSMMLGMYAILWILSVAGAGAGLVIDNTWLFCFMTISAFACTVVFTVRVMEKFDERLEN